MSKMQRWLYSKFKLPQPTIVEGILLQDKNWAGWSQGCGCWYAAQLSRLAGSTLTSLSQVNLVVRNRRVRGRSCRERLCIRCDAGFRSETAGKTVADTHEELRGAVRNSTLLSVHCIHGMYSDVAKSRSKNNSDWIRVQSITHPF